MIDVIAVKTKPSPLYDRNIFPELPGVIVEHYLKTILMGLKKVILKKISLLLCSKVFIGFDS